MASVYQPLFPAQPLSLPLKTPLVLTRPNLPQLVLVAFTSVVSYLTSLGYGKHTWDFDIAKLPDFALGITVAGTLVVTAAIWSKTSFCFTILRLTEGWMSWLVIFIIVSTNVFMGASAIFPWVVCKPLQKGWNPLIPGECTPGTVIIHFNIFTGCK